MTAGIYLIRNIVTARCYIGLSTNILARIAGHRRLIEMDRLTVSHRGSVIPMWHDAQQYGKDSFEYSVLEETDDLVNAESVWEAVYAARGVELYNILPCGGPAVKGRAGTRDMPCVNLSTREKYTSLKEAALRLDTSYSNVFAGISNATRVKGCYLAYLGQEAYQLRRIRSKCGNGRSLKRVKILPRRARKARA